MIVKYVVGWISGTYTLLGDRVFPLIIPQNTAYPAARVINNQLSADDSKSVVSCLDRHLVRIDIFMETYKDGAVLAKAIRTDLDRKHNEETTTDFIISGVAVENITDGGYEIDKELYHKIIDLKIYTKPL